MGIFPETQFVLFSQSSSLLLRLRLTHSIFPIIFIPPPRAKREKPAIPVYHLLSSILLRGWEYESSRALPCIFPRTSTSTQHERQAERLPLQLQSKQAYTHPSPRKPLSRIYVLRSGTIIEVTPPSGITERAISDLGVIGMDKHALPKYHTGSCAIMLSKNKSGRIERPVSDAEHGACQICSTIPTTTTTTIRPSVIVIWTLNTAVGNSSSISCTLSRRRSYVRSAHRSRLLR
jgi:hypothetical protein